MTHRRTGGLGPCLLLSFVALAASACGGRRPPASLDDCPVVCEKVDSCSNGECEEVSVCAQKC